MGRPVGVAGRYGDRMLPQAPGRRAAAAVMLVAICGCGSPSPVPVLPTPSATVAVAPTGAADAAQPVRVAIIVMENRSYEQVLTLPYLSTLATTATVLSDYHAAGHPSLPNYLALTSGTTWGITDDGYHALPRQDLGDQLSAAGIPWRAYMEGLGSDCRENRGAYAVKHDPFAYYGGQCPAAVVPLTALSADLASPAVPRLMWITPDLCHDMHDCSAGVGDSWLSMTVPTLLAAPAMSNGVLLITWDENDGGGDNHVLTVVLGSRRPVAPSASYTHASLLATVQDLLGVARLPATRGVDAIPLR